MTCPNWQPADERRNPYAANNHKNPAVSRSYPARDFRVAVLCSSRAVRYGVPDDRRSFHTHCYPELRFRIGTVVSCHADDHRRSSISHDSDGRDNPGRRDHFAQSIYPDDLKNARERGMGHIQSGCVPFFWLYFQRFSAVSAFSGFCKKPQKDFTLSAGTDKPFVINKISDES